MTFKFSNFHWFLTTVYLLKAYLRKFTSSQISSQIWYNRHQLTSTFTRLISSIFPTHQPNSRNINGLVCWTDIFPIFHGFLFLGPLFWQYFFVREWKIKGINKELRQAWSIILLRVICYCFFSTQAGRGWLIGWFWHFVKSPGVLSFSP